MPRTFEDNKQTAWTLEINYDSLRRVQADTGLDLSMPFPNALTGNAGPVYLLNQSLLVFMSVLWSLCRPLAENRKIRKPVFESLMSGDPMEGARSALMGELADFFRLNRRNAEAVYVEEQYAHHLKLQTNQNEPFTTSATNSPESSGSTPDGSPSAN